MGIEQRMESSGKIAEHLGIKINERVESSKPISSYHKHEVISKAQTKPHIQKIDVAQTAIDLALLPLGGVGLAGVAIRGLTGEEPMTPTQFGAVETIGALTGLTGAGIATIGLKQAENVGVQGVAPAGVTILPQAAPITNIAIPEFKLPDLSGLKTPLIIVGAAIAGLYIFGKVLSRGK